MTLRQLLLQSQLNYTSQTKQHWFPNLITKMFLHLIQIPICKFLPLVFLLVDLAAAGETRCLEREREALLRFKQGLKDDYGYLSSWGSEDECCEWGEIRCVAREREALLRFKQGLKDDYGHLSSSWGSADCCDWTGVSCSNTTGHVTGIRLNTYGIGGNISSDLLELHQLKYLDLSGNDFGGNSIPEFIGSIKSLEYLYLVHNNLSGSIPPQLGNLTNLVVLDVFDNSLVHAIPNSFANLSRLQVLYMPANALAEPLGNFFRKISCQEMVFIDISFNQFTGPIPDMRLCSKLTDLLLHHNPLSGSVPASLGQLSTLEYLDISADSLQGTVSESLFSKLHNLYWLDLSFNSLTLDLSPDWIPPFRLKTITLASCKIGPSFPTWLRTQTNISDIDISDAGISDKVPNWLWSLSSKVTYFNLSQNQLTGTIPDLSSNFFGKIDFSSNKFSGPLPLLHPNISLARFSQNMFSGSISFICRVFNSQMVLLDLSDNQLEGKLPDCWDNSRDLTFLNLNNNYFDGEIPHGLGSLRSLETLQLRGNNLSGKIPPTLKNCTNLLLIDVGGNKLEGMIPPWLGAELTNLTHLSFRQNRFHGGIPPEMCHLSRIQMLDLSGNNLSEQIPSCFDKFSSLADKNGSISKSISFYIDFKRSYYAYVLVQWKGNGLEYRKTLRLLKLIDLSNNRLVGNIPEAFSSLRGLISLNLSRNSLTGRLDPNIGEMEMLESLDLSNNRLSGKIPVGLARLHYLSVLDLANNSFTGQIPLGTQLQGFHASAYSGNGGLCGPPLALCPNTSVTDQGENTKDKDGGFMMLQEFYISLLLGFIVGFWGVVGSLVLMRSWRVAYFGFIDVVGDWSYVTTTMFLNKFKLN